MHVKAERLAPSVTRCRCAFLQGGVLTDEKQWSVPNQDKLARLACASYMELVWGSCRAAC